MRPHLSTPHFSVCRPTDTGCELRDPRSKARPGLATPAAAMREARELLAETEPDQPDYRPMLGPGHWSAFEIGEQYPNTSPCSDYGAALAEALAAFIAERIQ